MKYQCFLLGLFIMLISLCADGFMVPIKKANYKGSVEEKSQEAIIIYHGSKKDKNAKEDIILKVQVTGKADEFSWIIPFPQEPKIVKESPKLFKELFDYVQARLYRRRRSKYEGSDSFGKFKEAKSAEKAVKVLSRKVVGNFDIAVVRENIRGALNNWLQKEGYQTIKNGKDVLDFYWRKKYVFACIKITKAALSKRNSVELHPLRFSFKTGGRDGIYFPMKLTGLQTKPFDVNLYVFYRYWLNDKVSKYGYLYRGFTRKYRDWDSKYCKANDGKAYSAPQLDPFLKYQAHRIPTVTKLFQKLYPGRRYYLTNIQAKGLRPEDVRQWSDDLWLFPYYTNRNMVPYDARSGGIASTAWSSE